MKILVVEDFAIDREEVVSILQSFRDLSIEEIRTCENGMTALEMTDTFVPDVILCDVEMPYMDGFTLLREVRAQYPDMRFVFCSLYNRVEYFKNALDLDSNGYLLKPLDPMQLHDCLQRFSQQGQLLSSQREELSQLREQVEKNRESLRELFLINLLHGCLSREEMEEKQSELEMEGWFSGVRFAVIEVDDFFDRAEHYRKEKRQQLYYFKLWQTISKILHEEGEVQPLFLVKVENARFCCGFRRDDIEEQLFLDKVQRLIQRCKQLSVSLTVAVEPNVKAIGDLTRAFEQCSYMLRFKYSMGKGIILYVNDIPGASEMAQSPNMMDIQKELRYVLNQHDKKKIEHFVEEYYQQVQSMPLYRQKTASISLAVCVQLILNESGEGWKDVLGSDEKVWDRLQRFETVQESSQWMQRILCSVSRFLGERQEQKEQKLIEQVRRYVADHLQDDLHLEGIARHFFYSTNYLNSRFKKETNMTISEYITRQKIEASKKKLLQTHDTVAEIAAQVGYEHVSYFNYVFKKWEGMTPREFRQMGGKEEDHEENQTET